MTAATYVQWLKSAALSNEAIRKEEMGEESGKRGFTNPAADQLVQICAAQGIGGARKIAKMTGLPEDIIARAITHDMPDDDEKSRRQRAAYEKEAKRKAKEREARMRQILKIIARMTKNGDTVRPKDVADEAMLAWGTVRIYCRQLREEGRIVTETDNQKRITIKGVVK